MADATELRLDEIKVGKRLRSVNRAIIERLKESIAKIGLKTPVSVRYISDEFGYDLITGHNRYVACSELEWEHIPVPEETGTELDAELWEVDENLCRAELTELERGEHLAARKRIYEEMYPDTKAGA